MLTSQSGKSAETAVEDIERVPAEDSILVTLETHEDPQKMSALRRWIAVFVISLGALCATSASSMAAFTETGIAEAFHVSREVTILGVSLFVAGLGVGPLLVGPLSEVYGTYDYPALISYILFLIFTFPIAFAPNITVFLIFRLLTGFCGSAFLSVAGGSVSDLFPDSKVVNPMGVYTASPFIGPTLGPLIAGFINQNIDWRWTYRIDLCWIFVQCILLFVFVPETYAPVLLKKKAARLRKQTGNPKYYAPLDRRQGNLASAVLISCYKPFQLLLFDRMALLLNTWNALLLGILYLAFQAFPIIFQDKHHFNLQMTGLSFLGLGIGMLLALSTLPLWNRLFEHKAKQVDGTYPPEVRLIMGQYFDLRIPTGLFWLAFTTYSGIPWIVPIIASVPLGAGIFFSFMSTFMYLVTAYRPISASAMASNSALRCIFAAAFPLFAGPMYDRLGTVGATALLAGLTTLMAPLPFIFFRIGERLRMKSPFAVH
ncbi:major facilitator superfamily domain-containing protein [Pisolithus croceorrhizus]|nr:major facilitator superfamily domain-containing protein [Pisolithus croceorrhizus]KAI6115027.1 major facilitator superfamily domain-containing protein [Pisolithus croceorrhizus]KAI6161011.1 major facilitator superfamily domain-containing protein [Pisolithus thermaeus]